MLHISIVMYYKSIKENGASSFAYNSLCLRFAFLFFSLSFFIFIAFAFCMQFTIIVPSNDLY